MSRPSDREYELKRQVKELKEQNEKLELEVRQLKKQLTKEAPKEFSKKPGKAILKPCPDCGAEVKSTDLPHAVMELCSAGCGFRLVRKK